MLKKNIHIPILIVLFVATVKLFEYIGLWQKLSIGEPNGLLFQGLLFFAFYFILKTFLFEPYIDIFKYRDAQTTGLKASLEELKTKTDSMVFDYQNKIEDARLQALLKRERLGLDAEAQEKTRLDEAKKLAKANSEQQWQETLSQQAAAQKKLIPHTQKIAESIVAKYVSSSSSSKTGGSRTSILKRVNLKTKAVN